MTKLILLDIDGVLVQPGGYRAALRATVERVIGGVPIEEHLLTEMEKRGIASEWDMAPLMIAAYWDAVLSRARVNHSSDVSIAAQQIPTGEKIQIAIPHFDLIAGQYPAESAFRAGCFPSIPHELKKNLLTETRNVNKSYTMRVFQHFTLGSQNFGKTYNLPAEFETESLLLKYDHSNVDDSTRAVLKKSGNHLAAFTARPSHPPRESSAPSETYAPEAELALELTRMTDIPLIAFGKLEYIAAQHQMDPAALVKPAPFQALAAALAAWTGNELAALEDVMQKNYSGLPKSFELVVVEDTMGGIRSVKSAGEILQNAGFDVRVRAFGLTSGSEAKASAFEQAGVPHFAFWSELISIL